MKNGLPFMKAFTILLDINNLRKDCFTSFAMTIKYQFRRCRATVNFFLQPA